VECVVITAAHCLPFFPPCHAFSYLHRTYEALPGPLRQEPTVWAECLFVDPVAYIAVLGEPDGQEFFEQWNAFEAFVMAITPLRITDAPKEARAQLLSLAGEWFDCKVQHGWGAADDHACQQGHCRRHVGLAYLGWIRNRSRNLI
jgi:hypothetical protein